MASIVARQLGAKNTEGAQATIDMAMRLAIGFAIVLTYGHLYQHAGNPSLHGRIREP
jgi:Na+-driven multidrug efflux pump